MANSVHTARYRMLRKLLIDARKTQRLSQAAVAKRLGRVQTYVSKYERGERRLDLIEFLDVAAALGLDAHKLVRRIQATDS